MEELRKIFEHEIKRKLAERARSSADEYRILMNGFKFYDYDYTGFVNETEFVKSILRTGLSGFNDIDLRNLFKCYDNDKNNSGKIDYKNYCSYLCGREELNPIPNSQNEKNNEMQNQNIDNNNQQLNQKQKTPIQNRKTPITQEETNKISQNINEQQIPPNQSNNPQPQMEENGQNVPNNQEAKEYFQKLVNSLKDKININNGITYYTFLYELKNGSDENNQLPINVLSNAFNSIGINLPQNDLNNFFNLLDFSNSGKISLDDIINTIVDPIIDSRKYYIVNKFAKLDTEKKGEVLISLLKEKYNPKGHPDVISGKITEEEAFKQFCYTLDIYCGMRMLKDVINYKQFLEYYNGISSSILDENYFIDILNGVWDENNNINININNDTTNNIQQNPQMQNDNANINMNMNNIMNTNIGYQNNNNNNRRYNKKQISDNIPMKYNDSYADNNIGINSLLLGKSSHILPKSFGKRSFKKFRTNLSQQDLNNLNSNQSMEKQNEPINNNNNIIQESNSQNNYNKQNYNKVSMYQSSDLNQLGNNNNYDLNRYNRNIRNKYSYNPITNEYSQVNVNNFNIKNIKIKTPITQHNPQSNIVQENSINKEQTTISALNKLKNIFYTKGSRFIFSFQRRLSLYDFNHSSMISLENFLYISSSFNFNISLEELELIFNFFDKEKKGSINYNNLIQTIIGQITPMRDTIIKNIFEQFNKDNNGNVSLGELKMLFNANNHPDVINKKKSRGEIYGEFLDMIETYKEYLENMRGIYTSCLSLEDFINFYQIIGVDIEDDKIFEFMINNCWSNQNLNGNESGNYNNKYNSGNMYGNGNGNNYKGKKQDNLMARAGSQIINNIF